MCNEAAAAVDRVLPNVPIRQWVLSLPFELRRLAAFDAKVLTTLGRLFVEAIFAEQRSAAGLKGAECGATTHVQRFGGSLNLNCHYHVLVLDGALRGLRPGPQRRDGVSIRCPAVASWHRADRAPCP
jgi:hypothetical protein